MPGMSDESDRAGFLAAIISAPDDDLPREIFADYLDERGDPRGEFVRVQVELAKRDIPPHPQRDGRYTQTEALRRRERELYGGLGRRILNELPPPINEQGWSGGLTHCLRRGFVTNIFCTAADWSAHADALLAAAPIRGRLVNGEYRGGGTVTLTSWPRISQRYDEAADVTDFRLGNRAAVVRLTRAELERTAGRSVPAGREIATRLLAAEFPGVRFVPPTVGRLSDPARLRDRLASADIVS